MRLQPLSIKWLGHRTRLLFLAVVGGAAVLTILPSPAALAACAPTASTGPVNPPSGTTVTCSGTTSNQNAGAAAGYGTGDQIGLTINVGATGSPATVQGVSTTGAFATAFAGIKVGNGNTINIAAGSTVTADGSSTLVFGSGTILNNAGMISNTAAGQFAISSGGSVFTNSGTVQGDKGFFDFNGSDTIINSGTFNTPQQAIQIFNGGNTLRLLPGSSITGNVSMNSNSTLDLSGTGSASFNVSSIGTQYTGFNSFTKTGSSTWTLTGSGNQAWTVSAGTLVGDTTSIQGSITNNATFSQSTNGTYGAVISGTGGVTKLGTGTVTFGGVNTYGGGTTINAGTLAVSADNNLGNAAGGLTFGGGTLQFGAGFTTNRAITLNAGGGTIDTGANAVTLGGTIGGTDGLTKIGAGVLTVTGAGTYAGATTVSAGTLRAGATNVFSPNSSFNVTGTGTLDLNNFSQTIGSLFSISPGTVTLGSAVLTTGADGTSTTYQGAITGTGGLTKVGTGTFTLAGTENYSGSTNVNAGGLSVTGTISNSLLNVNAGGTLLGTGTVGAVNIASGGTLMPGLPGTVGTLNVAGNLVLASAAAYLITINGSNVSTTNIIGGANVAGATLKIANGSIILAGKKYTIMMTQGGVSGTFNPNVSFGGSAGTMTDDGKNVFLTFATAPTPKLLTSLLPSGSSLNVFNVAGAIDKFASSGGALPGTFQSLFNLAPQQLVGALTQLSGEAATGAQTGGFQLMTSFMSLLTGSSGGTGSGGGPALPFAPERADLSDVALAYASVLKAPPMAYAPQWSSWGAAFGGGNSTNGNPSVAGSHDITARTGGFAAGLDYHASPGTIFGVAMAGGGTSWSLPAGLGGGRSDVFLAGLYGSKQGGQAYVSGALTYGSSWVSTSRNIAVAGADTLNASYNAQNFGARLEGGYRIPSALAFAVSPYAAMQAQSFRSPAYSESGALGPADPFALSYASQTATLVRSELGSRFDRNVALSGGSSVDLFGRAAWAHDWQSNPNLSATFIGLPTATFVVNGAAPPSNVALLTAGAEWHWRNGWSFLAKFEGEFANRSDTYTGTARAKYSW
jgi:autotransporter-associated beta strand protein